MAFIRTLTGDIKPEELGFTYSHEHIICIPPYWKERGEDDLLLDDENKSRSNGFKRPVAIPSSMLPHRLWRDEAVKVSERRV